MKRLACFFVLFLCSSTLSNAAPPTPAPKGIAAQWGSIAEYETAGALRLNPALLTWQKGWGVQYYHADVNSPIVIGSGEGDALFITAQPLSFLSLGLGFQLFYPEEKSANKDHLGTHFRLSFSAALHPLRNLSIGINAHTFFGQNSDIQELSTFDIGVVLRPWNFLSLAMVIRDLNAPQWGTGQIHRKWEWGLSLRPLQDRRLMLSLDITLPETGDFVEMAYQLKTELTPGFILGAKLQHDLPLKRVDATIFLGFHFGNVGLQASGVIDFMKDKANEVGWGGWMASLWYQSYQRSSLIRQTMLMPLMDIAGSLPERSHSFPLGPVRPYFLQTILRLERIAKDPKVKAVLLRIGTLQCGFAKIQELREALKRFKKRGKKIFVYLAGAQLKSYYLASVADKIFLNPAGSVWLSGIAKRSLFFGKFLKKLGIKAQFVKFEQYKTAPNQYTQEGLTPAHKKMSTQILDDLFLQLKTGIRQGRRQTKANITKWFAKGIFASQEAKRHKLVDDVFYWDELSAKLAQHGGNLYQLAPAYFVEKKHQQRWHSFGDHIAILHIDGAIVSGNNVDDPIFNSHLSGAHTIIRYLIRARYDNRIRAVILRINSPGGGVMASDLIWRYVSLLSKAKPVVVSMGSVAASGGYYIAAPAHEIIASPATITGSIGIFAGKFDFSELLKRLGINISVQKRGANADLFSPYQPWTPKQKKALQAHIEIAYRSFLQKVAKGRKMDLKAVQKVAGGRTWSGIRAKKVGLVDRIGGLWTAIQRARFLAHIDPNAPLQYISWPNRSFWQLPSRKTIGISTKQVKKPKSLRRYLSRLTSSPSSQIIPHLIRYWKAVLTRFKDLHLLAIYRE